MALCNRPGVSLDGSQARPSQIARHTQIPSALSLWSSTSSSRPAASRRSQSDPTNRFGSSAESDRSRGAPAGWISQTELAVTCAARLKIARSLGLSPAPPRCSRFADATAWASSFWHISSTAAQAASATLVRAAVPQLNPTPPCPSEIAATTGTPRSLAMSSSQVWRCVSPCRTCASSATAIAEASSGTGRPVRPPRHHSATASRSTNSSAARSVASPRVGPAAQPMLSGAGAGCLTRSGARRKQRSSGTARGEPSSHRHAVTSSAAPCPPAARCAAVCTWARNSTASPIQAANAAPACAATPELPITGKPGSPAAIARSTSAAKQWRPGASGAPIWKTRTQSKAAASSLARSFIRAGSVARSQPSNPSNGAAWRFAGSWATAQAAKRSKSTGIAIGFFFPPPPRGDASAIVTEPYHPGKREYR